MAEMVICLLVAIATTLGAAGRAVGLLSTLPRTVVDILEAVMDILGAVADFLGAVTNIPGVATDILGAVAGILGTVTDILETVADILGAGVAQPLAHPAATASHTALPLVTAIAVVTEGEFVLFLMDKHRVVFALAVHTGKRLAVLETGLEIVVAMKISAEHLAVVIKGLRRWHLGGYTGNRSLNLINAAVLGQTGERTQGIDPAPSRPCSRYTLPPLPCGVGSPRVCSPSARRALSRPRAGTTGADCLSAVRRCTGMRTTSPEGTAESGSDSNLRHRRGWARPARHTCRCNPAHPGRRSRGQAPFPHSGACSGCRGPPGDCSRRGRDAAHICCSPYPRCRRHRRWRHRSIYSARDTYKTLPDPLFLPTCHGQTKKCALLHPLLVFYFYLCHTLTIVLHLFILYRQ